jgi:TRAP-type C4-dicarboxylate transport system permease small subunit
MERSPHRALAWLRRRAENVGVVLIAIMFAAFIVQIAFRYALDFPIGWTSELTVLTWLWVVLWGAAFVLKENEEIRIDLLYGAARTGTRRAMTVISGLALLVLYGASLPKTIDYVTFMKVEKTAYLKLRFDWAYSIYLVFLIAILVRYVWLVWRALRGAPEPADDGGRSGGL